MTKKIVWMVVSGLMALSLVMAACGPAVVEEGKEVVEKEVVEKEVVEKEVVEKEAVEKEAVEKEVVSSDEPQYGGTIRVLIPDEREIFDNGAVAMSMARTMTDIVYERSVKIDWGRGPAGTGEFDWRTAYSNIMEGMTGALTESIEIPEPGVWVLKIRQGVHWGLNPKSEASRLMNGREFTADDIVFNFNRYITEDAAYVKAGQPALAEASSIEKTGPWEVTERTGDDLRTAWTWLVHGAGAFHVLPPEVIEKYGDVKDWRNVVGTGPYMLTDLVTGSQITLTRNPNYWDKDPVGPGKGNQLPYLDTINVLIIPDISTQLAAMRSGRADWVSNVELGDGANLIETAPRLEYHQFLRRRPLAINMRTDVQDLPYKDLKVRQALHMAIDFQAILNDLYMGQSVIGYWPVAPIYQNVHVPMEELPENVQELFDYNPEKAKQLLTEAGYPQGFEAKMIVESTNIAVDLASIVKDNWAKVGVNLELQTREPGLFRSVARARSFDELLFQYNNGIHDGSFSELRGDSNKNLSFVNDPVVEAAFPVVQENLFTNRPKADEALRDLVPHLLEQCYYITMPASQGYTFWSPWLKNYRGETGASGYRTLSWFVPYVWVDRDLKESMIGRR
ncbi:ABC transporter substrate-binding protein [Chloroflexota bacterium]